MLAQGEDVYYERIAKSEGRTLVCIIMKIPRSNTNGTTPVHGEGEDETVLMIKSGRQRDSVERETLVCIRV